MLDSTWTTEFVSGHSSQPLMNVCISFAVVETFFVIAFVFSWYYNKDISNNNKHAFFLVLLGYMFSLGGVAVGILKIAIGGAGYHAAGLQAETLRTARQLSKAQQLVYVASIPWPRLAILCLYLKLFRSRTMRYIIYATGLAVMALCLFGLIMGFVNCRPFAAAWDGTLPARCTIDTVDVFRYYCIPNIITDAVILLIPLPAVAKLQVGFLTKVGLFVTFLAMSSGILVAVLRFVSVLKADLFGDITFSPSLTIFTIIEPGVYLIASTIPTLRPLIRRFFKEANDTILLAPRLTNLFRSSLQVRTSAASLPAPPRRVLQKKSSRSLYDYFDTVGQLPVRGPDLDEAHWMQALDTPSPRSLDEESLVCAHAIIQERFAREGRNPDGTLQWWSLQPVQTSPLRSSFVFVNK
ncbi:hypothetical protein K491DRAFT_773309 [Lophiostoma macrostomum CBS 122681]|uniref:Rhodopsin domain-containing protein n=1 Tax=Lophiostoma macrostomum CBS 122681 TaxID=1314788 RepID=A0A6A6TQ24_9PLEO|nr:hypothetical protein K491DRAFT_773309 [Lophiostoma macrostomum CBS 122681]